MKTNAKTRVLYLTQAGLIAAIYVVVTYLLSAFSFGEVQVRVSEMLTVLPYFTLAAIPGVSIGCLIANLVSGAAIPDIIFGSLATLVGAIFTYKLRKRNIVLAVLPTIIANTIVVPWVLKYAYGTPLPIPFMMLTVGIGEVISCGVLGVLFGKVIGRYKRVVFGELANK